MMSTRRNVLIVMAAAAVAGGAAGSIGALAQVGAAAQTAQPATERLGLKGYDPVAYFTEGRAMKGSEEFSYNWLGTPWQFASSKHRELFIGDPTKYAPQYGGYCVGEVADKGATINIDPEAWAIIDGKLYLSYSKEFMDKFKARPSDLLAKAEANWPAVETQLEQDGFQ